MDSKVSDNPLCKPIAYHNPKDRAMKLMRLVNIASLPSDAEIAPEWKAFLAALERPAARNRIKALMERGFHKPGDVENRLGYYVGQLGA